MSHTGISPLTTGNSSLPILRDTSNIPCNMITGGSTANLAIILVDAEPV